MSKPVKIGIIGDFEARRHSHMATMEAIQHTADRLSLDARIRWISTPSLLAGEGERAMRQCDGFWASPGSPYRSMDGAIRGVRLARRLDRPFFGT